LFVSIFPFEVDARSATTLPVPTMLHLLCHVPVVIMSLHKSVRKSLITTSVAVRLFAVGLAFSVKAGKTETLAATATYAAGFGGVCRDEWIVRL
jgi:hypothetical protein